ncbi:hypothetical protein TBLA_0G02960 [Henningerozyma blattae CBS 6284]|uniref:Uncharacterized protein n=1 Tax=Henningerozyma blattae (strain ATCC 34711 / CBS 6284 / DSM 70876 / NBRC 10599 / NRRL Y-10934 / UCD 77-7) TaxID=1071380 RepID=I2H781_HENB6|nr:hypothetical protein TBLA_0G02960 [Tetrapisispora blattae CBS 6284]CCH62233.1 hypothetical protein TBLA_0G02960 [Tetrapisispora blattae CBS 6284]
MSDRSATRSSSISASSEQDEEGPGEHDEDEYDNDKQIIHSNSNSESQSPIELIASPQQKESQDIVHDIPFTSYYYKFPKQYRALAYKYSVFVTWAIIGNYTRLGISRLAEYSPSYIASGTVIWSNIVACIIMGILQELKTAKWFDDFPELFLALTTGFCGCLSSYSSFILELFEYSTDLTSSDIKGHKHWPNRAYGIMEFLSVLTLELLVSMGSLIFGRKLVTDLFYHPDYLKNFFDHGNWRNTFLRYMNFLSAVLCLPIIGMLIVLVLCYNTYARGKWTLPPFFGIVGAILRMKLSDWFNARIAQFPIGTFIANELAVIVICVLTLIQKGKRHSGSALHMKPIAHTLKQCRVVTAIISGFCGSLSTISTFINEGYKLPLPDTLLYYTTSIFISYVLAVLLLGIFSWTRGLTDPVC